MTLTELYKELDARFPRSLSCKWDNDGIMVLPDGDREVRKVLCCLDCTDEAVKIAASGGFDLILAHHPLIFKSIPAINGTVTKGGKLVELIRNGIAVFSFHTRLDCADGGVNDVLAQILGLEDVTSFETEGLPMGRIGTLPEPTSGACFAKFAKEQLSAPAVTCTCPDKFVKRVALLGGSGGDLYRTVQELGADAYLTGEARYHDLLDAEEDGMCVVVAGHDYTEKPIAGALARTVREIDPSLITMSLDAENFTVL